MSKREWLKQNRAELNRIIHAKLGDNRSLNDDDRWEWVMNDEGLYNWARRDGVNV